MGRIQYAGQGLRPLRSLPIHHHDPWIVIVYTYGRGSVVFEHEAFPFQRGTVVCVPPRLPYAERSKYGFNSAYIAADGIALDNRPHHFAGTDETILPLAQLIVRTFNSNQRGFLAVSEQLFDSLLLCLTLRRSDVTSPYVKALREAIHQRWSDPAFRVSAAMNPIPLSPAHLRRRFAAEMKMPPVRYLLQHRIGQARRMLAIGGYSIKEVSQMCGFDDPYYFSRAYRKIEGHSPTQGKRA